MSDKAKANRAPLELRILDSEPDVKSSVGVEWLGKVFPHHFEISLMLEDQTPHSPLNWVVTFDFIFHSGEPLLKSLKCSGLGYQNKTFRSFDVNVKFTSPLEVHDRTDVEQVQKWQLNYVQENLFQLKRACFQLVVTNVTLNDNGTISMRGGSWDTQLLKESGLENFSRQFDTWQNKTVLTLSLLREVAQMYQDEVLEAERQKRRATPAKVISNSYGKSLSTADRWIALAREEGFLPHAEQGKPSSEFPLNTQEGKDL